MTQTPADTRQGLQFFGRISASVSHEIKNVFAVINEAAGLIEDFTLMAERGMPIDPERLKKAANSIQGQIRRGDGIVKNMNAFAHSTDEDVREIDLVDTLSLTVALTTRLADMKQVSLSMGECPPVSLRANAFDLMQLLHSFIAAALENLTAGDSLVMSVKPLEGGASFSLSVPGKDAPVVLETMLSFPSQAICANMELNESAGTCELRLSASQP
ncbi:sensor histidine kinase [Pseudodesulfovibrio sediminis]|uniref:histidine kinase n=1 Tax=Pseudodesulfovibrio sediminis TaxID=2810563 RepID=A0ABM7P9K2_9BACT|nr:sensor histidine kinase [Pseudodesulfovibrio sediminis]BCS89797.1 hypothetical protein PSDVSF_30390 [Pseudodesulfovibrio sediminis]